MGGWGRGRVCLTPHRQTQASVKNAVKQGYMFIDMERQSGYFEWKKLGHKEYLYHSLKVNKHM